MSPLLAALLLLAAPMPDPARAARAELDGVAAQIAVLKARRLAGDDVSAELDPLLVRAQALAAEIERLQAPGGTPPPAAGPTPEELHERADALRDDADRASAAMIDVDRQVEEARRAASLEAGLASLASESDLFGDSRLARLPQRSGSALNAETSASVGPGGSAPPSSTGAGGTGGRAAALAPGAGHGGAPPDPASRLRILRALRQELEARIASLRAEADRLEAESRAAARE